MWNTFRVPFFLSRDVLDVVEFPKDPCSSVPGAISVKWLSSDKKAVEAGAIPDGDTSFKHQSFMKNVKRGYVCERILKPFAKHCACSKPRPSVYPVFFRSEPLGIDPEAHLHFLETSQ